MSLVRRGVLASSLLLSACSGSPPHDAAEATAGASEALSRPGDAGNPLPLTVTCQYRPNGECCPGDTSPAAARQRGESCHVQGARQSTVRGTVDADFLALTAGDPAHAVAAGGGGDAVVGGPGADRLDLGAGDDSAAAGPGDDLMRGEAGADRLQGEEGDDRLFGNAGDDTLIGGAGRDHLYAGNGDDTLVIRHACEVTPGELYAGGPGRDVLVSPLSRRELVARGVTLRDIEEVRIDASLGGESECRGGDYTALPGHEPVVGTVAPDGSFSVTLNALVSLSPAAVQRGRFEYEFEIKDPQGRVVQTLRGAAATQLGQARVSVALSWSGNIDLEQIAGVYTYDLKLQSDGPGPWGGLFDVGDIDFVSTLSPSASKQICVVAGHGSFNESPFLPLYGTDLGVAVTKHLTGGGTQNFVFFGDTWKTATTPPVGNDDAFGTFSATSPGACIDLNLSRVIWADHEDFAPITVPGQTLDAFRTVATAFSVNHAVDQDGDVYALYSNPNAVLCTAAAPIQLIRHQPGSFGPGWGGPSPLFEQVATLASSKGYPGIPGACAMPHRFLNLAAATTSAADGTTEYVYVWGRASFWGYKPDPALHALLTDTFLLRMANWPKAGLPTFEFWAGAGTWSTDVALAVPVITQEPAPTVNQMSVTYDSVLERWIMLYGGRAVEGNELGGVPGGPPDPALGIYVRTATAPEGPWSEPITIWAPADPPTNGFCEQLYTPGNESKPGCVVSDDIVLADPPSIKGHYGAEYGAALLPSQTTTEPGGARTIRWLVSTWNPYHVIEMETTLTPVIKIGK